VLPILRESGLAIVLEPGRHVIAPAGALLTRVVDVKRAEGGGRTAEDGERYFVVMDAGMTELIRPMMYNAFHRIEPVVRRDVAEVACDVVGPLCESSDTLGRNRMLPRPEVGELYAVLDAGAYGSVMASNYNRRMLPAEVLVEAGTPRLIRRRQTLDDVLALEL
jgi:diaminopimelate decarboxylase